MNKYNWQREVERVFDGDIADPVDGEPLNAEQAAYEADLQRLRDGVQTVADRPEIGDAQFSAFMAGIRDSIESPRGGRLRHRGLWAAASVCAASFLVALSVYFVLFTGSEGVHSQVDAAGSEIPGVTVDWTIDPDGNAEVWVSGRGGKDVF